MNAGVVEGRLGTGERRAVVAEEDNKRILGVLRLLERVEHEANALIEPADGLIILRQFAANIGLIGEEIGYIHISGFVADFLDTGVGLLVAEVLGGAVWIGKTDDEQKRVVAAVADKLVGLLAHLGHAAIAADALGHLDIEVVHRSRQHMNLADNAGAIAVLLENARQALDVVAGVEVVYIVSQAILPVAVRVQSGVQRRAAGTARRHGREAVRETHAVLRQAVDIRRANLLVAVAAELETEVVGNEQHDISRWAFGSR